MKILLRSFLAFLLTVLVLPALAQQEPKGSQPDSAKILISADTAPEFPGGNKAMLLFLQEQLKDVDLKGKPEGLSILTMVVTKEGEIKDITIVQSLEPTLDKAAIEAVKNMPKWVPGTHKGKIEDVRFTLPVRFKNNQPQKTKTKQKQKF